MSVVPTIILSGPPCGAACAAATVREGTVPVVSIGRAGGAYEASPRPPPTTPLLDVVDCGAAIGGCKARDWYCDCGREYCGSSRRSTTGAGTEAVASDCEAKGLGKFWDMRVDMSPLQPASPNETSATAATCGPRRERSNSMIRDMVTHSYATNCGF